MTSTPEPSISFVATDRRAVVAHLCAGLRQALASDQPWAREEVVVPWHATAPTFTELPGRVVRELLAAWDEAEAHLLSIEFSGYLETDQGPRAWGFLVLHEGETPPPCPRIDEVSVVETEAGYRCEVTIHHAGETADA
jgi:hypothetical protein